MRDKLRKYIRLLRFLVGLPNERDIHYITSDSYWSLNWDGRYITEGVRKQFNVSTSVTQLHGKSIDDVLHFASLGDSASFLKSKNAETVSKFNQIVCTVFHGDRGLSPEIDSRLDVLLTKQALVDRIVVSTSIMKKRFLDWGIDNEKIIQIPLGVDTDHFFPASKEQIKSLWNEFGISEGQIIIGSFQKDGNGFGEGLIPKHVKGPDVFLAVIEKLAQKHDIFVLLTGPARGYMKRGLDKINVPYRHDILDNYLDLANYFRCLDLYVVASREEGGPKSLLEAPACGVPLVTTNVGMTPDIHEHEVTALITEIEDVDDLAEQAGRIIEDVELRTRLVKNGLEMARAHDWQKIAARYYHEVYAPILNK